MAWRLRDWWGRRTPRQQAVIAWGVPLLGFAVAIGALWVGHRAEGVASRGEARTVSLRLGITAAASFVALLVGQRSWNLRALGLLALLVADAGLHLRILGRYGPQPVTEWERDLIQSFYDASTVLLIGLAIWLVAGHRNGGRAPDGVPPSVLPEPTIERDEVTGVIFDRRRGERRRGWQERRVRELEAENARLRWELDQRDRLPGSVD